MYNFVVMEQNLVVKNLQEEILKLFVSSMFLMKSEFLAIKFSLYEKYIIFCNFQFIIYKCVIHQIKISLICNCRITNSDNNFTI